jgi:hypothetical protein
LGANAFSRRLAATPPHSPPLPRFSPGRIASILSPHRDTDLPTLRRIISDLGRRTCHLIATGTYHNAGKFYAVIWATFMEQGYPLQSLHHYLLSSTAHTQQKNFYCLNEHPLTPQTAHTLGHSNYPSTCASSPGGSRISGTCFSRMPSSAVTLSAALSAEL